jgi:hypothetical protein
MADATTLSDHSDSAAERARSRESLAAHWTPSTLAHSPYNNHFANYSIKSPNASRRVRFPVDAGVIKLCVCACVCVCVRVCVRVCVHASASADASHRQTREERKRRPSN